MGVCDVCNKGLGEKEGYILTTLQVVSTPGYWKKAFSGPMGSMMSSLGMSDDSFKAQFASQMASQTTPWMVCNDCIGIFSVDKTQARQHALRWYESGGTFTPPGSGAVPLSKVNMGDGKVYVQGGSPEALEMANRLKSAQEPKKESACFIATATFTSSSQEVYVLRQFRDRILWQHPVGRLFVSFYYRVSPPLANWIERSSIRRRIVRRVLAPIVKIARYTMDND
jgi:hypothetical protein